MDNLFVALVIIAVIANAVREVRRTTTRRTGTGYAPGALKPGQAALPGQEGQQRPAAQPTRLPGRATAPLAGPRISAAPTTALHSQASLSDVAQQFEQERLASEKLSQEKQDIARAPRKRARSVSALGRDGMNTVFNASSLVNAIVLSQIMSQPRNRSRLHKNV